MKKYEDNRDQISSGDLILFRTNRKNAVMTSLSKMIQKFDKAYYNHVGLVFAFGSGENRRLFILDSNAKGVEADALSVRMDVYEDFCVMKPRKSWREQEIIESAVSRSIKKAEEKIKYDFALLVEIAMERSRGRNFLNFNSKNKDICSEFAYRYIKELYSIAYDLPKQQWGWISPQDLLRFRDKTEFNLLLDDNGGKFCDYDKTNKR